MQDEYEVKRVVLTPPKRLFEAWLDSREHGDMTGGKASETKIVGEPFSTLDGLVAGRNLEIEPYHRIVQEWNTAEAWNAGAVTRVEIRLATGHAYGGIGNPQDDGTTIILRHSAIGADQTVFSALWWEDRYFRPMDAYFSRGNNRFTRPQG